MRIKLDENLPSTLTEILAQFGHDVDTSPHEGLAGRPDADVWAETVAAGRLLITQDLDFSDVRKFAPGTHPGLVLVRLDHPSRIVLEQRILELLRTEDVHAWKGCLVVVTEHKVRVRRP